MIMSPFSRFHDQNDKTISTFLVSCVDILLNGRVRF